MQRGFACKVKNTKLPFSLLLLRLLVKLSSSQLWARLSVKRRRKGGGDCVPAPVLFMAHLWRSQPSPALSSPTHSFISKTDESAKSKHRIQRLQSTRRVFPAIPTSTHTDRQRTALWSQQLVQRPNPAASSLSKHTRMLPNAGVLKSIQNVSVVISIIYSKLFLELERSDHYIQTQQKVISAKGIIFYCERARAVRGGSAFLSRLHSQTDGGINRLKGLSKVVQVVQEGCSRRKRQPPANSQHYPYSHRSESWAVGYVLNCLTQTETHYS